MKLRAKQECRVAKVLVVLLFFGFTAPSAAQDEEMLLAGSFGVGSDYTFRGISQTMGDHAIQASVDLSLPSGLYAYAWGSNVDFVAEGAAEDGARLEVDLAIGYAADITDDWSIDFELIRYVFPGTTSDVDYDYNELMAVLWYGERYNATVAFSENVDGTGNDSVLYGLGASFELLPDTTLAIDFGHYDLSDAYGAAYSYFEAALTRSVGNAAVSLAYSNTHRLADQIYDRQVTGPRFVLSFQIEW